MNKVGRPSKTVAEVDDTSLRSESLQTTTTAATDAELAEVLIGAGRIQSSHLHATVASRVIAEEYLKAKSFIGKGGRIPYTGTDGKARHVASLGEFCNRILNMSQRRCQELAANYEALGDELYDQAERIGLRARDYQALRALPSDEQAIVKQAIESGSKDAALDALHELALRNAELKRRAADDKLIAAAKDKMIETGRKKLEAIEEEAEARRLAPLPEQEAMQLDELRNASLAAQDAIQRLLITVTTVMNDPKSESTELAARQSLDYVVQRLADVCGECGVAVDVLGERVEPGWMRPITEAVEQAKTLLGSKA